MMPILPAVGLSAMLAVLMILFLIFIGALVQEFVSLFDEAREYVDRRWRVEARLKALVFLLLALFVAAVELLLASGIWWIWSGN